MKWTSKDGKDKKEFEVFNFTGPGIALSMYNLDNSIKNFARACMNYGLERKWPVYLSTKNTILKAYDGRFKDLFQEVFEKEFSEKSNKIPTTSEINLKIEQEQPVLNPTKKAEAQIHFGLGMRFENGEGVPQDYNEAIRWYRLAADQGHGKAQEKLNMLLNKAKEHFD